jgi:hypothetical protein
MNIKTKTALSIIIPLLILGLFILFYFMKPSTRNATYSKPDYKLTSKELNLEFLKNDSIAIHKYGNRIIELSGVIAGVKKSHAHGVILTLDDPMMGIKCVMDSSYKDVPMDIQTGNIVRITGICVGSDHIIGVMMNQCILTDKKVTTP